MAEELDMKKALTVFDTLCDALDERDWHYHKNEDDLVIDCTAHGEDLPMDVVIQVVPDSEIVLLFSRIPVITPEDKRLEMAVAISAINNILADGSFDYNFATGEIFYRITNFYTDREISKDVLTYMLFVSLNIIDDFNDKLLMIAKGMLSVDQFLASLNG